MAWIVTGGGSWPHCLPEAAVAAAPPVKMHILQHLLSPTHLQAVPEDTAQTALHLTPCTSIVGPLGNRV